MPDGSASLKSRGLLMSQLRQKLRELRVLIKRQLGVEPRVVETVSIPLEFHGTADGWKIQEGSLGPRSIVVDVGVGEDASFSESLIDRYGVTVNAFDPTPRAIAYARSLGNGQLRLFELGLGVTPGL